jgi:glyoxylase I family protein
MEGAASEVHNFTIHHAAISSIDMAKSIAFLEIFWYRDQVSAPESAGSLTTDLPRIGVKHFALEVDSIHEAKKFVENRGIASNVKIQQGRTGVTYFFIKDPNEILVEILEDKCGL